jgi:Rod binding domain-containing protein
MNVGTLAPDSAAMTSPQMQQLWQKAQDFEAMALGELLAPMFDSVDNAHGLFGGGDAEATWRPMLTQQIARQIAAAGGIGLAAPVFRQMLQMQEAAPRKDAT